MKKREKVLFLAALFAAAFLYLPDRAYAMHIMEGYLPAGACIAWGAVALPFLALGMIALNKRMKENTRNLTLLAMSGAFIFVLSSLKIPSVTGSCSHMTGTGLAAILFGPVITSVLGLVVLLFQALLLAHGGLTTLGANTFSMAIAGPLLSYGIYVLCKKAKLPLKASVFLAAFAGDIFTYCVTSLQLALAYPSASGGVAASFGKFLLVFAPTQLPLAVLEGVLTAVIVSVLCTYAKKELKMIGFIKGDKEDDRAHA